MTRHVLIIDDNMEILQIVSTMLLSQGYHVATASTGREGLEMVRRVKPDLVLLDLKMPNMDGWEVLSLIKADPLTQDIPVALFTVKGEYRDKLYGMQKGAVDYITKPFSFDHLTTRLEKIFAQTHH